MKECKYCGGKIKSNLLYCSAKCRENMYERNRNSSPKIKKLLIPKDEYIPIKMTKNRFNIFLYETYLNAGKDIDRKVDKMVFALGAMLFFKQEVDLFYGKNDFEDAKIDLDFKRLDKLSYMEILGEVYNWYIGEVEQTSFK